MQTYSGSVPWLGIGIGSKADELPELQPQPRHTHESCFIFCQSVDATQIFYLFNICHAG